MDWDKYKRLRSEYEERVGKKFSGVIPGAVRMTPNDSRRKEVDHARLTLQRAALESRKAASGWRERLLRGWEGATGVEQLVNMKRFKHNRVVARKLARDANRSYLFVLEMSFLIMEDIRSKLKQIRVDPSFAPMPDKLVCPKTHRRARPAGRRSHFDSTSVLPDRNEKKERTWNRTIETSVGARPVLLSSGVLWPSSSAPSPWCPTTCRNT